MMVPKRSLLVTSAALLCLGTVASAQSKHTQKIRRVTKPLIQADLDLTTGKYTIGSRVNQKSKAIFNTSRSLNNVDFSGFVGIDSVQCEWFDSAVKDSSTAGGKSQIMTSFLFAYCSSQLATNSGGVGGSATVSFVEGYQDNTLPLGTLRPSFASRTAVFNLSGLPANTASSSFFGGFNCFFLRVRTAVPAPSPNASFDGGQALADGVVGWSWDFRDLSNFAPLAHTFPFLACVQSCSGTGPDKVAGMTDFVDQYCGNFPQTPPFTLLASFTFGTTTTFTSFSMEVREANAISSGTAVYNPTGPAGLNPSILSSLSPPVLGSPWKISLNCSGQAAAPAIFVVEFLPGTIPPSTTSLANGNVLVAIAPAAVRKVFVNANHGGGTTTFPPAGPGIPLPLDLQFLNACYQVQGFCGNSAGPAQLSNGLNETVGSQ